jgi:signal transduction histidine kinase
VERLLAGKEIKFRLHWFVLLRYLAILALALLPALTRLADLEMSTGWVWPLLAVMALYNTGVLLLIHRVHFVNWRLAAVVLAHVQILVDFGFLTCILHFTGGVESPVLFYYVFHAIISAILLTPREAYLEVSLGVSMVVALVAAEYYGLLPHHSTGILAYGSYQQPGFVASILVFFVTMLLNTVWMTESIAREIRNREYLVRETVQRLQEANEELRRQDRVRSQFVRTVAHDLKDPLVSVQTTLRVVLDGYVGEVPPKVREMVERAEQGAVSLITMIRDMLDLSRMRTGWVENRSTWDVRHLVEVVEGRLKPLADRKQQTLTFTVRPEKLVVNASFDAFEQVLLNLVSNAIKYSPEGTRVHALLVILGRDFLIRVDDEGIGVPQQAQERLFTEFYRAENARRLTRDGTGLGLSIVKVIAEQYRGTVGVVSPYDGRTDGSRFEVRIPREEVHAS